MTKKSINKIKETKNGYPRTSAWFVKKRNFQNKEYLK